MYLTDESERSLGAFILISLILHALLIFLYPQWNLATGPGLLLGGNGGIITIMPIDDKPSPTAQVTRKPDEGVRTEDTKSPTAEARVSKPEPEVKKEVEPKPEVKPEEPKQDTSPTPAETKNVTSTDVEAEAKREPEQQTESVEDTDISAQVPASDDDTLLTSEHGQEVVVSKGSTREEAGGEASSSEAEQERPTEVAEPSTPPLPPLPAAGSVVAGGGRVQYPKNAINEGLSGSVKLDVYVPKGATKANRIVIRQSSGLETFDQVASLTVQHGFTMTPLLEDYVLSLTVEFGGPPSFNVEIRYDDIQYVKNDETGD